MSKRLVDHCVCGRPKQATSASCQSCNAKVRSREDSDQMTDEELDALIEERSRPENLPYWWHREECAARDDRTERIK